ncbi:MAG: DNA-deoxyinosine glycosylase [Clostridiales Family XIII bacterium]|jgi:hypoxanthine-DNA glycosylase|nr:DNA-deoxyinosine glycosylase [Clostridiales Family XIII bacterium]
MVHPWGACFDEDSEVLILGTFPSPKSRDMGFCYGHPQNAFWRTLAAVLGKPEPPRDVDARRAFALENHVALWDVLHACEIDGASDLSIRNPEPNRFAPLLAETRIRTIFTTGRKATELYAQLCEKEVGMPAVYLPSTSPANRAMQAKPAYMDLWGQVAAALDAGCDSAVDSLS